MPGGCIPVCVWWISSLRLVDLEAAKILRCSRIGRAAEEGRKGLHAADVVVLRLRGEAAHGHVFDHARTQRANGLIRRMGDHRGLLSSRRLTLHARERMSPRHL
jgi:hypothetical protein